MICFDNTEFQADDLIVTSVEKFRSRKLDKEVHDYMLDLLGKYKVSLVIQDYFNNQK